MKERYRLLLKLKSLEFEIKELLYSCNESCECFELLKEKLNHLCSFVVDKDIENSWHRWGTDYEIAHNARNLRYISCKALCNLEKYQANCLKNSLADEFKYTKDLEERVLEESRELNIDNESKVVFIGSGAMPVSAFAMAERLGSEVLCVDIDNEAIKLSKEVAKLLELEDLINFTNTKVDKLEYLKEATHIIIASLVEEKLDILSEIKNHLKEEAKVILRYGNGIKSVFNFPLDTKYINDWKVREIEGKDNIYETLVLEK